MSLYRHDLPGSSTFNLKHIAGLPIQGKIYHEYNPREIDDILQLMYKHYFQLARGNDGTLKHMSSNIQPFILSFLESCM